MSNLDQPMNDLETYQMSFLDVEKQYDAACASLKELKVKLDIEQKANQEKHSQAVAEKQRVLEKRFDAELQRIHHKQAFYEEQKKQTEDFLFNSEHAEGTDYEADEMYLNKKALLDQELAQQMEALKVQFNLKMEKLRTQFQEKYAKKDQRLQKQEEEKRRRKELYLESIKNDLSRCEKELAALTEKKDSELNVLLNAPKSRLEVKLEEQVKTLEQRLTGLESHYNQAREQVDTERARVRRVKEARELEEHRRRQEQRERLAESVARKVTFHVEPVKETPLNNQELTQLFHQIEPNKSPKEQKEANFISAQREMLNKYKKEWVSQHAACKLVEIVECPDRKMLLLLTDAKGKAIHHTTFKSNKEFEQKYPGVDYFYRDYDEEEDAQYLE